ncbi:unnamed protein product [Adineta ricciae]|uniref:Uncharacterized protein n=1 Tax=Adineta ricciae TaxID=249248 RepID=A0A814M378_ADIRI|nr:unnamed protein product [Adineta ricciae]CAF1079748.1 unnamed protein product [Adineta ricciae]
MWTHLCCILIAFILFWTQEFSYAKWSIDKFSSSKSNHRQAEEHLCIFDCEFTIPFDAPMLIPTNCRQESTTNACEIDVKIELSLNYTVFTFPQNTISLIINEEPIDSYSIDLVDFYFAEKLIAYSLAYKCSYGDQCEWNYVQNKLQGIINQDYQTLFDSLSPLIYNDKPESNVTHCYSLDEPVDCQSGVCDFTQALDTETFQLVNIRECLIFSEPKIIFGQYRISPDPVNFTHDYLYFACNINECNSHANELTVKDLIKFTYQSSVATMYKHYVYPILTFYFILSCL